METKWKMEPGKWKFQRGFTLVELLVSIGILTILFALTTINLNRLPSSTSQSSSYDRLVTDLRGQQTKAMAGYNASSFGIHFENTSYTVFNGMAYSGSDPTNYKIDLDPNLSFTGSNFPADSGGSHVVFSAGTGDVSGLTGSNTYSVSISDSLTSEVKTVTINQYGATY